MKKNKFFDAAGILLLSMSILFLFRRITTIHMDFTRLLTPLNIVMVITMPFLTAMIIFSNSYCWKMNLQLFSKKHIPAVDAYRVYAGANIMKYLPGNVGHYAGRQLFGSRIGIKQVELAAASILEIIYGVLSMAVCSFIFFIQAVEADWRKWYSSEALVWIAAAVFAGLILGGLAIYACRRNKYVGFLWKLLRNPAFLRTFLYSVFLCSFGTVISAMEFVILFRQYSTLDFHEILLLLAASCTAVFIGFVTPGVPGGIGVREAVLIEMLVPFFMEDIVILAAISQRLIMILGDLLAVSVSKLLTTKR